MLGKNLPAKTTALWRLRIAIFCANIICIIAFACRRFRWRLVIIIGILVIFAVLAFWYIPALCRSYRIVAKNGAVIIEHGVIIKTTHIMPFAKMIYAETFSTPLAKAMGLTALTLKATKSIVFVPEMETEQVEVLVKTLSEENDEKGI